MEAIDGAPIASPTENHYPKAKIEFEWANLFAIGSAYASVFGPLKRSLQIKAPRFGTIANERSEVKLDLCAIAN